MKASETAVQNDIKKKLSDTFLTIIELFYDKYFFLTLLINISIVTKPVVTAISVTDEMFNYYTADTAVVGNRPCRFFGVLSCIYPDNYLFMTVFKIMYFAALLLLTLVLFKSVKRITVLNRRILTVFLTDVSAACFFYCTHRPMLSLAMMFALIFVGYALYSVLYGNNKMMYLVPVWLAASVVLDVRSIYLCVCVSLIILADKRLKQKNKSIPLSVAALSVSVMVFVFFAIVTADVKDMNNITTIQLVTEWIPNAADTLLSFTFEDIFQGLCYIYIPVVLICNHLIAPDEKMGIIEGNNV